MLQCPPAFSVSLPGPPVLGNITLGIPVLAWGLLAMSVPIMIHLFFRERAQREVFPAMRFLIHSHASATRTHRLRHFLLLLARTALIALAVGLLGRLGCTREGGAAGMPVVSSAAPASVVFCIDNSASMGYRYQGRSRVQIAVDWARNLMQDGRHFGPGSQFAVVSGTPSPGLEAWREDQRAIVRSLDTLRPSDHALAADQLLGKAFALLSSARFPRQEVYVFNDLTESSWSDNAPIPPDSLTGLYIMDCGQAENRNVSLNWSRIPTHELPAGVPVSIPVQILNGDLPSTPTVHFRVDGKPRGQQTAGQLQPHSQVEVRLNLPALEPGPHRLTVDLEPGDALACDNSRFGWLISGALPRVGLIQENADDQVGRMMQAMIAPPQLPAAEQRYRIEPLPIDALLTRSTDELLAIVLADVRGLNGLAWERLSGYVKDGGTLIIVPGPNLSPEEYKAGHAVLSASIDRIATCDPPLRPAASNLSHPYLLPFADLTIDSINDRHAFARLSLLDVAPEAAVIFPFADGAPALVEGRMGKGRAILFAFSPAAEWGQFGTQAAPLLVLLHQVLQAVRPPLENMASFTAGRPVHRAIGEGLAPLLVRSPAEKTEVTVIPGPAHLYSLPTALPQFYLAAEKSNPEQTLLYYSVNVAESESQPERIRGDILKSRFNNGLVRVVRPDEILSPGAASGQVRLNWTVPLGLALIMLLLIESSFSNRFYRSRRG